MEEKENKQEERLKYSPEAIIEKQHEIVVRYAEGDVERAIYFYHKWEFMISLHYFLNSFLVLKKEAPTNESFVDSCLVMGNICCLYGMYNDYAPFKKKVFESAIKMYDEGLKVYSYRKLDMKLVALYNNKGFVYEAMGMNREAEVLIEKSRDLYNVLEDKKRAERALPMSPTSFPPRTMPTRAAGETKRSQSSPTSS